MLQTDLVVLICMMVQQRVANVHFNRRTKFYCPDIFPHKKPRLRLLTSSQLHNTTILTVTLHTLYVVSIQYRLILGLPMYTNIRITQIILQK